MIVMNRVNKKWEKFKSTGKIEDYLKYKGDKQNENDKN